MTSAAIVHDGWPSDWPSYDRITGIARAIAGSVNGGEELASFACQQGILARAAGQELKLPWFKVVMRNRRREWARKSIPSARALSLHSQEGYEDLACENATPEESAMRVEAAEGVLSAMQSISERRRSILQLKYFQGMEIAAIAAELGVSERTVERDHRIALEVLGGMMEDPGSSFGASVGLLLGASHLTHLKSPAATATVAATPWVLQALVVALLAVGSLAVYFGFQGASRGVDSLPSTLAHLTPALASQTEAPSDEALVPPSPSTAASSRRSSSPAPVAAPVVTAMPGSGTAKEAAPAAAPDSTTTFSVTIELDGQRVQGWRAFRPAADPDSYRAVDVAPPLCEVYDATGKDGVFTFDLPASTGDWKFTFTHPKNHGAIVMMHDGQSTDSVVLRLDTASATVVNPLGLGKDMRSDKSALVSNPQPAVWILTSVAAVIDNMKEMTPEEEQAHAVAAEPNVDWHFRLVGAGTVRLMRITSSHHPDRWIPLSREWSIAPGENATLQ